jgi:cytochrome bd-type quinol oxidase subunit 2
VLARSNVKPKPSTDWTIVWVAVALSVMVLLVSFGIDHGQSARLDRLEKDNTLQQQMIKELGQKVAR